MQFDLDKSIEILERTPEVLYAMLSGLSQEWTHRNEGGDSWCAYDIVGHLIFAERTNWIQRIRVILGDSENNVFEPFDRFGHFQASKGKTLAELLEEFRGVRKDSLVYLKSSPFVAEDYIKEGIHPAFGRVTLSELLSTWTVHDLSHIAQISRVMSKQYKSAVGPWVNYLRVLNS